MPPTLVIKTNAKTALRNKWPSAIGIGCIILSTFCMHIVLMEIIVAVLSNITGTTAASVIGLGLAILINQFFGMPLLYGALRWFWFTAAEADVPVSEVFCYFSRGGEYLRALSLSFRIFLRIIFMLVLCFLPSLFIIAVRHPYTYDVLNSSMPYWASSMWVLGNIFNTFGTAMSIILLLRYFAAPILMINDRSLSPQEALNLSVIISKNANGRTFGFLLSFLGWFLLSLLIMPIIYTAPLFLCSYAVYCRFLINHYNRTVSSLSMNGYAEYPDRF